ncbi:prepilin-type N-terminal cleavage/methylation domain-containing protein [bacterium]|nr:prepilin-type N-terminal cleavage/methylation domain-containing protein [bacterium]
MTATYKYHAYTLVEMLIVVSIFIIIAGIGFAAFYGLRDSITLNEKMLSLEQDVRYAQRAALFLERDAGDRWIYGVGLDFSSFASNGTYKIFKWCSQFNSYGDVRTTGELPNFDSNFALGPLNGSLPVNSYGNADCNLGSNVSELIEGGDFGERVIASNFNINIPVSNNATGDLAGVPVYILFEAVSGRAFLYDVSGNVVNYDSSGSIVSDAIDFVVTIESPRTKREKDISISNISGKINIETSTAD